MSQCVGSPNCRREAKPDKRGFCWKHYEFDQQRRIASGEWVRGWEPADKVVAHLDFLLASGMSYRRIAEHSDMTVQGLYMLRQRKRVRKGNADNLYAVNPIGYGEDEKSGYVLSVGPARRFRALIAIGYTQTYLSERIGLSYDKASDLVNDKRRFTQIATARRISEVFEELQLSPAPPSRGASRSRNTAARKGWLPPLAWDEDTIDDPAATPQTPKGDSKVAFLETYAELREMGLSDNKIAARMGIQAESLRQRLRRTA